MSVETAWMPLAGKDSSRRGERVRLVVVHDTEGIGTARDLAAFFGRPDVQASSHVGIDDTDIIGMVDYGRAAWTLRSANPISDNAELCGGAYARWTREQWLAHPGMLRNAARWIADRCRARGLPCRLLTDAECRAAVSDARHPGGVIDHWTYTRATGDGTHWDPGSGFPWDVVMEMALAYYHGQTTEEEDDMANADEIAGVLDGYYTARRAKYGEGSADQHDLGAAIFDIEEVVGAAFARTGKGIGDLIADLVEDVAALKAGGGTGAIDLDALAAAVADELDRRARDGDPATGPAS